MARLQTLQGRGGGRVPTSTHSIPLNRHELAEVIRHIANEHYPHVSYATAIAQLHKNPAAQQMICEAVVAYQKR